MFDEFGLELWTEMTTRGHQCPHQKQFPVLFCIFYLWLGIACPLDELSWRQYTICENHTTVHGLLIHTLVYNLMGHPVDKRATAGRKQNMTWPWPYWQRQCSLGNMRAQVRGRTDCNFFPPSSHWFIILNTFLYIWTQLPVNGSSPLCHNPCQINCSLCSMKKLVRLTVWGIMKPQIINHFSSLHCVSHSVRPRP